MDTLFIRELKLHSRIGVHAWERQMQQVLYLDLEFDIDVAHIAAQDALSSAIDYEALSQRLIALAAASEDLLIETLANRLANCCQQEFNITKLKLTLMKPGAVPQAKTVGVCIGR